MNLFFFTKRTGNFRVIRKLEILIESFSATWAFDINICEMEFLNFPVILLVYIGDLIPLSGIILPLFYGRDSLSFFSLSLVCTIVHTCIYSVAIQFEACREWSRQLGKIRGCEVARTCRAVVSQLLLLSNWNIAAQQHTTLRESVAGGENRTVSSHNFHFHFFTYIEQKKGKQETKESKGKKYEKLCDPVVMFCVHVIIVCGTCVPPRLAFISKTFWVVRHCSLVKSWVFCARSAKCQKKCGSYRFKNDSRLPYALERTLTGSYRTPSVLLYIYRRVDHTTVNNGCLSTPSPKEHSNRYQWWV